MLRQNDSCGTEVSELVTQWSRDQEWRRQLFGHDCRPVCGIGAVLDGEPRVVGKRRFYPNRAVRWVSVRDVPAGILPGAAVARGAIVASAVRATLRNGAAVVDFSGSDAVELHLSRDLALNAAGDAGKLLDDEKFLQAVVAVNQAMMQPDDSAAFPAPMLAFSRNWEDDIYAFASCSVSEGEAWQCHGCRKYINFQHTSAKRVDAVDGQSFTANCPHCRVRRRFYMEDAIPGRISRHFPEALREAFLTDVRNGLPLRMFRGAVYRGPDKFGPDDNSLLADVASRELELSPHRFTLAETGYPFSILLPPTAAICAKVGDVVLVGETWALGAPMVKHLNRITWADFAEVFGRYLPLLQEVWFNGQTPAVDKDVLIPASLVGPGVNKLSAPTQLYWEFNDDSRIQVFQPGTLARWNHLRLDAPMDISINAELQGQAKMLAQRNARHVKPRLEPTPKLTAVEPAEVYSLLLGLWPAPQADLILDYYDLGELATVLRTLPDGRPRLDYTRNCFNTALRMRREDLAEREAEKAKAAAYAAFAGKRRVEQSLARAGTPSRRTFANECEPGQTGSPKQVKTTMPEELVA